MAPIKLDTSYDALVVVLDDSNAENYLFQSEMKQLFEKQRMLYYKHNTLDADAFFNDVSTKIANHEVMLPHSKRIIFCRYLDLNDLNDDWLKNYREQMESFRTNVLINDGYQHYHLTFFRYRAIQPLGEAKEKVSNTLAQFWNKENQMSMGHAEFLLYADGLSDLNSQDRGIARFLSILSIRDYWKVFSATNLTPGLHIIAYDDYYEKRAQDCQAEIDAIEKWLNVANDSDFMQFETKTKQAASTVITRYKEEMRGFKKWSGLYPISVRDYTPHGFWIFKKYTKNARKHAELEKEKAQQQEDFVASLNDCEEKKQLFNELKEIMNYPDYLAYDESLKAGNLLKRVENKVNECFDREDEEERNIFIDKFKEWFTEFVEENMDSLNSEIDEKKDLRVLKEYEMLLANHFDNLANCFERIRVETHYQVPTVIQPVDVIEIPLVNGDIGSNWMTGGYKIQGISDEKVAILPSIAPCEIQYLKIGSYISADNQQALDNNLNLVLR